MDGALSVQLLAVWGISARVNLFALKKTQKTPIR